MLIFWGNPLYNINKLITNTMEIKTKFGIGDIAYCIMDGLITKVKITKITIKVSEIYDYHIGTHIEQLEQYNINIVNHEGSGTYDGYLLFESLDACVKHFVNNVK